MSINTNSEDYGVSPTNNSTKKNPIIAIGISVKHLFTGKLGRSHDDVTTPEIRKAYPAYSTASNANSSSVFSNKHDRKKTTSDEQKSYKTMLNKALNGSSEEITNAANLVIADNHLKGKIKTQKDLKHYKNKFNTLEYNVIDNSISDKKDTESVSKKPEHVDVMPASNTTIAEAASNSDNKPKIKPNVPKVPSFDVNKAVKPIESKLSAVIPPKVEPPVVPVQRVPIPEIPVKSEEKQSAVKPYVAQVPEYKPNIEPPPFKLSAQPLPKVEPPVVPVQHISIPDIPVKPEESKPTDFTEERIIISEAPSNPLVQPHPEIKHIPKIYEQKHITTNSNTIILSDAELTEKEKKLDDVVAKYNEQKASPSPEIKIKGKTLIARIVVDRAKHRTFIYDDNGKIIQDFPDAVGKSSTPTPAGIRYVARKAKYPYGTADDTPKVNKMPDAFGTNLIYLRPVNPKTGGTTIDGRYLHGTNMPESIGTDASHGCMRHKNEDIDKIINFVSLGDFIKII